VIFTTEMTIKLHLYHSRGCFVKLNFAESSFIWSDCEKPKIVVAVIYLSSISSSSAVFRLLDVSKLGNQRFLTFAGNDAAICWLQRTWHSVAIY